VVPHTGIDVHTTFIIAALKEEKYKELNLLNVRVDIGVTISWNVNSWTRYSWRGQGEEYDTYICTAS
jgi:hypothetical protein